MTDDKSFTQAPLGHAVDYEAGYDPALLFPIARADGRAQLGIGTVLPFHGFDIWNAYELSWLNVRGKPQVACCEIRVPADSPNIVESKSLKLYLNSLNQLRFVDAGAVAATIRRDLQVCIGASVDLQIYLPELWPGLALASAPGDCLDDLDVAIDEYHPRADLLRIRSDAVVERRWFSRLLRSRCPVTGQPDWGTVCIEYRGRELDPAGLLAYIVSFRQHQDFHEHCVERMFCDLVRQCAPAALTISARYLRRGGIDINPWRSTGEGIPANRRLFQQ